MLTSQADKMANLRFVSIIAIVVCVVIGIGFYIASCVYHVKKGTVIIVERMQEYYGTFDSGWHWFWIFVYRRVGCYRIDASKEFRLNNGNKVKVHYKLVDAKTFHYNKMSVPEYINKITLSKEKVTFDFLKENLATIGVELVDIRGVN